MKTLNRNPSNERSAILLVVDRWNLGFLGAYGNAWIETPTFDEAACEGALFDRHYTSTLDPATILANLLPADMLLSFREAGVANLLLTDCPFVTRQVDGELFDERVLLEPPRDDRPAESLEQTHVFRLLSETVRLAEAQRGRPYFLFCFAGALGRRWDAPLEYREKYRDEDDPAPYAGTAVPWLDQAALAEEDIDPDVGQAFLEAYAGEITVLDESLFGVLEALRLGEFGPETLLLWTAARGIPMGTHRRYGLSGDPAIDDRHCWSETLHLPLLLRFPDLSGRTVRSAVLSRSDSDIAATLREWFAAEEKKETGSVSLRTVVEQELPVLHESIVLAGGPTGGLITPEWFLRTNDPGKPELYAKPDDFHEINDVAVRCPEIAEKLSVLLRG